MSTIVIDFSQADENLVPEGEHQAIVYDVALRDNKAGDAKYLNWQFKIVGGEAEGRSVFHITSLKPTGLFRLRELLVALDYQFPDGAFELNPSDLLGKKCTLVIVHTINNQGRKQASVKEVLPAKESSDDDPFADENADY